MVASYTSNLRLTKQGDNDNPNSWGDVVNTQVIELLEDAVAGVATINCTGSGNINLSTSTVNGGVDDARHAVLELTGLLGANIQLILPAVEKIYIIRALQTGGYTINVRPVGASSGIDFVAGKTSIVYTNGTSIYEAVPDNVLLQENNLSDVADAATARQNLGLEIGVNVQAYDASLAALSSVAGTGIITQTAPDTFTTRSIAQGTNVTVTNGDGVAGNPTVAVADASDTVKGVVELATNAEVATGTATNLAVTPAGISNSPFVPKVLLNYNPRTSTINYSVGVSSVTKNSTGNYTINFTNAFPNAFYVALFQQRENELSGNLNGIASYAQIINQTTTNVQVRLTNGTTSYGNFDPTILNMVIFS
jgi:hypothetical protein